MKEVFLRFAISLSTRDFNMHIFLHGLRLSSRFSSVDVMRHSFSNSFLTDLRNSTDYASFCVSLPLLAICYPIFPLYTYALGFASSCAYGLSSALVSLSLRVLLSTGLLMGPIVCWQS